MVTDFSSWAIDAALAGTAVVHWVPDLDDLDHSESPPALRLHDDRFGPVAMDDAELIAALRVAGDPVTRASAVQMATSLVNRLASMDTGHATDALLDHLGF
jgi:CDP-glycerol glycerophosphotransferase (TagB/SpsB family)